MKIRKWLRYVFEPQRKPIRGLLALEWAVLVYMALTALLTLFLSTKLASPEQMLWGRLRILVITLALWGVYRLLPCRATHFVRVCVQMALLSWWYPDTYEFNRLFPNLDHLFAAFEQQLFGCQPALFFGPSCGYPVFSELMHLGYYSYYPLILVVCGFYFLWRYQQFDRTCFVVLASFFVYYLIYIALPVAGPQFYYQAIGTDQIAQGIFPSVGHYFADHREAVVMPGWPDGLFYHLVEGAHAAGERPTAAFPSSHVGVTTILMLLALKTRNRRLVLWLTPFYVLLCVSTVYIQAHYVVDAIAGFFSAILIYYLLDRCYSLGSHHRSR